MPRPPRRAVFAFITGFGSCLRAEQPCPVSDTRDRWFIRDPQRRVLGEIRRRHDTILEARDAKARFLGSFDPKRDETRDAKARLVAYGDVLSAFIMNTGCEGR